MKISDFSFCINGNFTEKFPWAMFSTSVLLLCNDNNWDVLWFYFLVVLFSC